MSDPPSAPVPADVEALLTHVETCCARAADVVTAAARAVAGEALSLRDAEMPAVFTIALAQIADELEALGDRALRARTGGAAS